MQRFVCTSHGLAGAGLLVRWQKTDLIPPPVPPHSVGDTLNFFPVFFTQRVVTTVHYSVRCFLEGTTRISEKKNLTRINRVETLRGLLALVYAWLGLDAPSGLAPDPLLLFLSRQLKKEDPPIRLVYSLGR
jgi:hypothetical protein